MPLVSIGIGIIITIISDHELGEYVRGINDRCNVWVNGKWIIFGVKKQYEISPKKRMRGGY